jgi:cytoskeletal protein CcmA (bactofilin family)
LKGQAQGASVSLFSPPSDWDGLNQVDAVAKEGNILDTPRLGTTIGPHVTIKGDIRSEEDLLIDGQVEGTLDLGLHRLVVGPNAQIQARITAREVEVQGVMHGNVEVVEKIILRKTSKVIGDLKMAGVVIEDGANFKGMIDIIRPEDEAPPAPAVIAKPSGSSSPSAS